MAERKESGRNKKQTIDPQHELKYRLLRGLLFGIAAGIGTKTLIEHLKGDEENAHGDYLRTVRSALRQLRSAREDPANFLLGLPENRSMTRLVGAYARQFGTPVHKPGERMPFELIPDFILDLETYSFGGNLLYAEEITLYVGEGRRTISTLTGPRHALALFRGPEEDRALRILSRFDLGKQAMQENGLTYPPLEPKPDKGVISTAP